MEFGPDLGIFPKATRCVVKGFPGSAAYQAPGSLKVSAINHQQGQHHAYLFR